MEKGRRLVWAMGYTNGGMWGCAAERPWRVGESSTLCLNANAFFTLPSSLSLSLSLSLALSAFISIFSFRDLRISECQIQIHSQPPMLHCQLTMDSWGGCRPPPINLQLRAMTFETEGRDMNISKGKSNPSNATSPAFT